MKSGASSIGRGGGRRPNKTRRARGSREEEVLVDAVKELISEGWKTYNRFTVGYLGKLGSAMKKVFPGIDLKGQPHINYKITGWKRLYAISSGAIGGTGVGYNETTGLLESTNEQWEIVVKNDPNAKNK